MANANYTEGTSRQLQLENFSPSHGGIESTSYNPPSASALSNSYNRGDIPHQTVKVSRRGSVEVVQDSLSNRTEQPSMNCPCHLSPAIVLIAGQHRHAGGHTMEHTD